MLLFGTAILADFTLMYIGFGATGRDYIFNGPGLGPVGKRTSPLLCLPALATGAVFLLLSMMFRNPTPAAMLVLG